MKILKIKNGRVIEMYRDNKNTWADVDPEVIFTGIMLFFAGLVSGMAIAYFIMS